MMNDNLEIDWSRIKIKFITTDNAVIDHHYNHQFLGLIYKLLKDKRYSSLLHQKGYEFRYGNSVKKFKFFCVSGIKFQTRIKSTERGFTSIYGEPMMFSIQIASPIKQFTKNLIEGLLSESSSLRIGSAKLFIAAVELMPQIPFNGEARLRPVESPILVKKPMPYGKPDKYLFPGDPDFDFFFNKNLHDKYIALFGKACQCEDGDLELTFCDAVDSKKTIEVRTGSGLFNKLIGTTKPFIIKGCAELINIGLYCGFGANNAIGCGYVELF